MSLKCTLFWAPVFNSLVNGTLFRSTNRCLYRCLTTGNVLHCEDASPTPEKKRERNAEEGRKHHKVNVVDPLESIKYMESDAYKEVYGKDPVWKNYRRNIAGHYVSGPRKTCIRGQYISTSTPCPVCRDDYLVLDYRNIELLKQFLEPVTGEALDPMKTGLCMRQQKRLKLEVWKAQDYGYLLKYFPFRVYDYHYYYDLLDQKRIQYISDPEEREKIEGERKARRKEYRKMMIKRIQSQR